MSKLLNAHHKWSLLLAAHSIIYLSLLGLTLEATTVEKLSLEELARRSKKIVVGRCVSTESRWNEKNLLILTFSKFLVNEDLKGKSDGWVTVMTVGGTVGGITQTVSGTPEFSPDDEVVLFLEATKSSHWQPVGLSQGRFRVLRDSTTNEREVVHDLSGLELYDTSAQKVSARRGSYRAPLESFLGRVRELIRTQR